jgi:uroporphyrinogen decarboxylase
MYYEVFQPREKALWGRIHQLKPDVAVFLHCCGGIYELLPGIIDAGCDILNPVQISAKGMDPARLKREFGDQLCFWGGGCDTQTVLPFGTPQEGIRTHPPKYRNFKAGRWICFLPGA